MRRRTTILALVVAAGSMGVHFEARSADRVELRGTTVLTGATAGVVRVRLAHTATIKSPLFDPAAVHISGPGDLAGFALVADDVPDRDGWVLVGGRIKDTTGSVYFLDLGGDWTAPLSAPEFTLEPGDYSLYLFPGSGSTEISIRLSGLEGTTRLTPTRKTAFGYESLKAADTSNVAPQHFTGSAAGALGGKGLVFVATWFQTELHAASSVKTCFWRKEPPEPHASLPNCGDALVLRPANWASSSHWVDDDPSAESTMRFYSGSWHPFRSGFTKPGARYGVSVAVESASVLRYVRSLALWLTY